mgnify:CR=1 FL=1
MGERYVDTKGRLIFVRQGLDGRFMTMYKVAGKWDSSGAHRLKSKALPARETESQAQADLDAYAAKHGWETVDGEPAGGQSCANCGADKDSCQPYQLCISEDLDPKECVCRNWKEERKEVAKKTYYTKCGRTFEKNSTAEVTGYTIDLREDGTISEGYQILKKDDLEALNECAKCPFKMKVAEGWPQKFKRWECRAGSEPPNQTTEWTGSLEDKNTIHIHSLDHNLLEEIRQFCENHPDLGAAYNADSRADCRRTLAISCSQNKKGMAAKKELIDKFFTEKYYEEDRALLQSLIGKEIRTHYNTGGIVTNVFGPHTAYGPGSWSINYTKDGKPSKNHCIINSIKVENGIITCEGKPLQIINPESKVAEEQKCRVCGCTENNGCHGGCYWVQEDLCSACACGTIDCPFNDANGACNFKNEDPGSPGYNGDVLNAVEFYNCTNDDVQLAYKIISDPDSFDVPDLESCAGCAYHPVEGKDTCNTTYVDQKAKGKCGWYNNPKTGEMGDLIYKVQYGEEKPEDKTMKETHESNVESLEIVKDQAEIVTFDYSSVDAETANFLQEKATRITEIRIKSVVAIGKELKEAQDRLANNKTGTFLAWVKSLGIDKKTAYNYINGYNYIVENFHNIESAEQIQPSLLFAVSKPSAPKELQEAVLAGDITTHKEYQALLQEYKQMEARAREAEEKAKRESDKWYHEVNASRMANARAEELEHQVRYLQEQLEEAGADKIEELRNEIAELQDEIRSLNAQLDSRPIEAVATTVVEKYPEREVNQTSFKVYGTLLSAKNISDEEIHIVCQGDIHRRESILEFLEDLLVRIPKMLQIIYDYTGEER